MQTIKKDKPLSIHQVEPPPKLFAWLASVNTVLLMIIVQFVPRGGHQILRLSGVVLLLMAAVFIFTPFYLLSKYGKAQDRKSYMEAGEIVHQGLYAIIRHPQYFGYILLACGFTLLSQHWITVLLTILIVIFFYFQAVQEERYCLTQYGESYEGYLQKVPRFNLFLGVLRQFRGEE